MSQLAALVAGEADDIGQTKNKGHHGTASKKSDPVNAILASAGVEYTHENSEVIGSSKVEARLSRRAEEAGNDIDMAEQHVFANTQARLAMKTGNAVESDREDDEIIQWRYNPPDAVMKRQFCTMAKTFGFSDATEFALVVEGWTQAQRRNCLDKFYQGRREKIKAKRIAEQLVS